MQITFHGGARSVTGSNYLLDFGTKKLLVDCGMFQGSKYSEDMNYERFPYDPAEIDLAFITHSHTDHVGRLPKLYKEGFKGKVCATNAALDLMKKALPDNLKLITQEAEQSGHEPLFTLKDLEGVLKLAHGVSYEEEIDVGDGIRAVLHDAGHILGSAIIEIEWPNKSQANLERIYFTGDLGNPPTPLLQEPYYPNDADYVVIESAYGSRTHEDKEERRNILRDVITDTVKRGGVLMIPSFAMERTQELLYELNNLFNDKKIPKVPVFVDSPLAINLTEVYKKYPDYFNKKTRYIINSGDDIFNFPGLKFTRSTEESKKINEVLTPKIIIAGSGMSTGGRILHHERRYLSDPKSTILFVGYQVKNSLGRRILDAEKEVRIFGEMVPVNCHVEAIGGYSAHADQNGLLKWVKSAAGLSPDASVGEPTESSALKKVFVVQGEEESSLAIANKIKMAINIDAVVPNQGESFEL